MPQLTLKNFPSDPSFRLSFWRIDESAGELLKMLPPEKHYQEEAFRIQTNEKRRCEWLAARVLLHAALGRDAAIAYEASGRPILAMSPALYVSISHSHGFVALAISQHDIGIDIEVWSPRAWNIHKRFLHGEETVLLQANKEQEATLLWCAKEAAFKRFHSKSPIVISDIRLRREGKELVAHVPQTEMETHVVTYPCTPFALAHTKG